MRDIAIISDAVETKEDAQRKDEIEKSTCCLKEKLGIPARDTAPELYKPRSRKYRILSTQNSSKLLEIESGDDTREPPFRSGHW